MLDGVVLDDEKLTGNISLDKTIYGKIIETPTIEGKMVVSVRDVPFYETNNESGGTTVYISREVMDNGS